MAQELSLAHRVVVVMNDYEWEFENALVSISGAVVEVWYEDDSGLRQRVATAPLTACFIEWIDLEEVGGLDVEEADEDDGHEHHEH